tara:strand:+ start:675 stop:1472 length:798 start_codon:yes stop_codon:yes gene_type:complete
MIIGVVGVGVVGQAVCQGFEGLGHDVRTHDLKLGTSIKDVLAAEICFICVPTPSKKNEECNIDIVASVVDDLNKFEYAGIVAIKSTVTPGTTNYFSKKYLNLEICFVPEFLRERSAAEDFIENHDLCVIGTDKLETYKMLVEAHGHYPKKFVQLPSLEAEFVKYFNNIYNATLITFANSFYEICKTTGADYTKIKNTAVQRDHINDLYLSCNEELRGFGGPCLPKDTRTIASLAREKKLNVEFFTTLLSENSKYKTTVFEGMRKE